ncbi:MAG TPA: ferredoxin [Synergistaceae bacterium]|nr:ferredoxin [Synergistaceae bacterium]HPJ24638.1 ferredoxin [Synergistaceae bacterium]HPQ36167.1 ferredoxin [Synergistaceae bacterium]
MTVSINTEECIGCGVCVQICPAVFELDESAGKARVISDAPEEDCIKEAAESCPVGCISIK